MTKFSISQTGYPKKIILDKDTVCVVSIPQVDSINVTYIRLDECNDVVTLLQVEISNHEDLLKTNDEILKSKSKEFELQKQIIVEKSQINIENEDIIKKQKRAIKWLRVQRDVLGVGILILGSIILF